MEAAGLTIGAVSFLFQAVAGVISGYEVVADSVRSRNFSGTVKEHGYIMAGLLNTVFADALAVIGRVERHVVHAEDAQVLAFMDSYGSSFNMVGVAGAIIAQVAISALSLSRIEDTHWSAETCFVTSLTTGALAVFFSCAANPALHGLHSAEDIKDFLTKPAPTSKIDDLKRMISRARSSVRQEPFTEPQLLILKDYLRCLGQWQVASPYAAIMLVLPMILLRIALNAFLIGLGIYLGFLYTGDLIPSFGNGSIAILMFYLCSSLFGLVVYYSAQSLKHVEHRPLAQWQVICEQTKRSISEASRRDNLNKMAHVKNPKPPTSPRNSSHNSRGGSNHEALLEEHITTGQRPALDQRNSISGYEERVSVEQLYAIQVDCEAQIGLETPSASLANIAPEGTVGDLHVVPLSQADPSNRIKPCKPVAHEEVCVASYERPEEQATATEAQPEDFGSVLQALVKAQEESLQATRQLLKVCSMGGDASPYDHNASSRLSFPKGAALR